MYRLLILSVGCGGNSSNENAQPEKEPGKPKTDLAASPREASAQSVVTRAAANEAQRAPVHYEST